MERDDKEELISDPIIQKTVNDVYKNLHRKTAIRAQDIEDIRQEVICTYLELTAQKGEPPSRAYLYATVFWRCFALKTGKKSTYVDSISHYDLILMKDRLEDPENPETIYEEKMRFNKSERLKEELLQYKITADSAYGIIFSLWWIGLPYDEIAKAMLAVGLKPATTVGVYLKINKIFREIRRDAGIFKFELVKLRNEGLKEYNRKRRARLSEIKQNIVA